MTNLPPIGSTRVLAEASATYTPSQPENCGREVKIYAHFVSDQGRALAAYVSTDHMIGGVGAAHAFTMTPKQIAAEECEAAVSAMWTQLNLHLPERHRIFDGKYRDALFSALATLHKVGFKLPGGAQ